jgi:hypothetical protein
MKTKSYNKKSIKELFDYQLKMLMQAAISHLSRLPLAALKLPPVCGWMLIL